MIQLMLILFLMYIFVVHQSGELEKLLAENEVIPKVEESTS